MTLTFQQLLLWLLSLVGTTAITLFLKDRLEKYLDYRHLKTKLDSIAGLQATVLFENAKYRIQSIDKRGMVVRNDLQTVFIPIRKVLENIFVLPNDAYDTVKKRLADEEHQLMKARMFDMMDDLFNQMFPKMFSAIEESIRTDLLADKTELSFAIGVKLTKLLEDEGIEIKKNRLAEPRRDSSPKEAPALPTNKNA